MAVPFKQAIDMLGGLDILINNAGGVRAGRLENTPEAELQAMIDVDLLAPILLIAPHCRRCERAGTP